MPLENFSSLYFLSVGESGCGKEYAIRVIPEALNAAKLSHLIGPSSYSSEGAVFSELENKPAHITVTDEFGAMLANALASANFHKRQALEKLKEVFSRLGSELTAPAYSTMTLTPKQKQDRQIKPIKRPALTILGMSTPKQFYEALNEQSIEGGFLNRLIIVETNIGMQEGSFDVTQFSTPQTFIDWCAATRNGPGNLSCVELGPHEIPATIDVEISSDARTLFTRYETEAIERARALKNEGLHSLEVRSREKALRLALILAVSENPNTPILQATHAEWAIAYIRHYTAQTVNSVREHMVGSKFARWCALALTVVKAGGERGRTIREIFNYSRPLKELQERELTVVLQNLQSRGDVQFSKLAPKSGRGKERNAWVALERKDGEDDEA